jgi:hypothetical protein
MNLLNMKKIMKMNGKKKTKIRVLVNVETKMNMKKTIEANVKLKVNTMPQMGMKCCRVAGHFGDQVKAVTVEGATS